MVNPLLPPSPEKKEKGLASPIYFLGSVETGFIRTPPLGCNTAFLPYGQEHPLASSHPDPKGGLL